MKAKEKSVTLMVGIAPNSRGKKQSAKGNLAALKYSYVLSRGKQRNRTAGIWRASSAAGRKLEARVARSRRDEFPGDAATARIPKGLRSGFTNCRLDVRGWAADCAHPP